MYLFYMHLKCFNPIHRQGTLLLQYSSLLRSIKYVVYLWHRACTCCQWQRLFSSLGVMWLVRLCHENCTQKNYESVECQLCAQIAVCAGEEVALSFVKTEMQTPGYPVWPLHRSWLLSSPTLTSTFQSVKNGTCVFRKFHSSVPFCCSSVSVA